jgi:hypothetical protein
MVSACGIFSFMTWGGFSNNERLMFYLQSIVLLTPSDERMDGLEHIKSISKNI